MSHHGQPPRPRSVLSYDNVNIDNEPDSDKDSLDDDDDSGTFCTQAHAPSSPRPSSARQRGVEARYIRTSISPDRILRRRRKLQRDGYHPRDVIIVSSDPEDDVQDVTPPGKRPRLISSTHKTSSVSDDVGQMSADSGRRPHALPPQPPPPYLPSLRPSPSPRISSTPGSASAMSPRSSQDSRKNKLPPWLRCALGDMYRDFPDIRVLVRKGAPPLGPGTWEVQCQVCGDAGNTMIIPAGPSETLHHLIEHLREVHDNLAETSRPRRRRLSSPGSSISERTRAGPRSSQIRLRPRISSSVASTSNSTLRPTANAVVHFLEEQGLSADSAGVLRAIGICDEKRMRHLGRLSSPALERLEKALAEKGLDFAACLLVREGLCKRGGMPDSGFDSPGLRSSTSHPVVQFLEEQGLSADSADALQAVGICDEKRMQCLGGLPSHALDRLEKALAERGLDFAACLLVREGLCKRGRA